MNWGLESEGCGQGNEGWGAEWGTMNWGLECEGWGKGNEQWRAEWGAMNWGLESEGCGQGNEQWRADWGAMNWGLECEGWGKGNEGWGAEWGAMNWGLECEGWGKGNEGWGAEWGTMNWGLECEDGGKVMRDEGVYEGLHICVALYINGVVHSDVIEHLVVNSNHTACNSLRCYICKNTYKKCITINCDLSYSMDMFYIAIGFCWEYKARWIASYLQ